ncbi:MAG TPA: S41 family peptidase [Polyangiaceae bacterium]|jgi:C-terminal processing protease CtpA/Prc
MMRFCRVWAEVRYLDPRIATGSIDWDGALVAALPQALAAQTDDDELTATKALLGALHDPVTRVDPPSTHPTAPPAEAAVRIVDGVTVIPVRPGGWHDIGPTSEHLVEELTKTKLAVIDLRATTGELGKLAAWAVDRGAERLTPHAALGLPSLTMEHRGYRPQEIATSGDYLSLLASVLPSSYPAAKGPHPARVVFLSNTLGMLPDVAWAMQRAGDAVIVVHGVLSPEQFAGTDDVELPGGSVARLRVSEAAGPLPKADLVLDSALSDAKVEAAAIQAAKHPPARSSAVPKTLPEPPFAWRPDATYAAEPYPSRERRVLALFRFWSVIHYFYPYLPLMGDTWDQAVAEALPAFESAANEREYALAVAALAAQIPDGHTSVRGSEELSRERGKGWAPFEVRVLEGQVVVTGITDPGVMGDAKLAIGDVVTAIDGEPLASKMAKVSKYVAASNEVTRAAWSARNALRGDPAEKMKLTVRGKAGTPRDVVVARTPDRNGPKRTGPVFRLLDGGIGYADLDRLEVADVDLTFEAFKDAPAIIFDMRGYPHGTAWSIAPRLNVRKATVAAQIFEPFVSPGGARSTFFEQQLPKTDKPLYRGKTVMLIDERTMSQAEHTGLFFEAANGTTFIGSQTAGANGDVTDLSLPGGLHVQFTGHDIRHADGRQLQRVGLVPAIEVKPTIDGIRAGRDEVLERALTFLRTGT